MNKQEIMEEMSMKYDDLVQAYRDNGKNDYDTGRVDGFVIAMQNLERLIDDDSQGFAVHRTGRVR